MEKHKSRDKISDAILIGFFTAYSYLISYQYQRGFYSHFNLPTFLIEISLTNILTYIISIFGFFFIIYVFINGLTASIPNDVNHYIVKIIKRYIFIFTFWTLFFIIYNVNNIISLYLCLGVTLLMIIVDFVKPLFSQKKIKGYANKIIAENEKIEKNDENLEYKNSINSFMFKHFPLIPNLLFIIFITSTISFQLGNLNAINQEVFTIINEDIVILGTYNNNFIVSEVNVQSKTLKPYFHLISNQEDYKYTRKSIGCLKLE